jgi:hypothetical protein
MTKRHRASSTYITALLRIVKCEFQNGSDALGLPLQLTGRGTRAHCEPPSPFSELNRFEPQPNYRVLSCQRFSAEADSAELDHGCVIRTECRIEAHSREVLGPNLGLDICRGEEGFSFSSDPQGKG